MRHLFYLFPAIAFLLSCKTDEDRKFPDVADISTLRKTAFAATMEETLPAGKNVVYTPTLLFAWNEVRDLIKVPIQIDPKSTPEFTWLNNSNSYQRTLLEDEYETEVRIEDDIIAASAFFRKALPFARPFQRFRDTFLFQDTKVESFGMTDLKDKLHTQVEVLYYKDDDNFVLKLLPKDAEHEIIFIKGVEPKINFVQYRQALDNKIVEGAIEKNNPDMKWKYQINAGDAVRIPIIAFNLEANYRTLEGQQFSTNAKKRTLTLAYQRNALLIDESGAIAESKSQLHVKADSIAVDAPQDPAPKKLFLNKPFVLFLKRTTCENPYFIVNIENAELLLKPDSLK